MDFGIGLILSFTDNATAGINNAVNSLTQLTNIAENASSSLNQMASLSALSVVSDRLGSGFLNAGSTIMSTLTGVIGSVNETGRTLMYAENQLNALYRDSGKTGKEVIGQIQEYAKTSMFEFENLIPAVTSLKSVGIEAFDSITSSMGNSKNNLLDYASALASFAPQMKNAYGTGINAAIGAMREYIAEGNAMSLKRGAGLDITGILGEDKGATIEERTRQVADLIEQLGMLEMVDVMKNSPMTKLSNMGDVLFQFKGMIANSGVYDAINSLIDIFADFVNGIDETRLQNIADTVGSALSSLITPVKWLAKVIVELADGFISLIEHCPGLAKLVISVTAVAGVLLLIGGVILKITSAFAGFNLMMLTLGTSFSSIGGLIATGVKGITAKLLPLTVTFGLLYLAWKTDFGGIRTLITSFLDKFSTSAKRFSEIISIIKDAWDFELSEENFKRAQELGILPFISRLLDLKYRFGFFKEGFVAGWNEISNTVKTALLGLVNSAEGTPFEGLINTLTAFLEKLASGDTEAWYKFGESFGKFAGNAMTLYLVIKSLSFMFKSVNGLITTFTKVSTTLSKLKTSTALTSMGKGIKDIVTVLKGGAGVTNLGKFVEALRAVDSVKAGANVMNLSNALKTVFGTTKVLIGGIALVITGVVTAVTGFVQQLKNGFSWFWEIIKWIGIALAVVGAIILGAAAWPAVIIGAIVGLVTTAIVLIKDNWEAIKDFFIKIGTAIGEFFVKVWDGIVAGVKAVGSFFSSIGDWVNTNVIQPVANFFVWLWNCIVDGVKSAIDGIKNFFSTIANWIYSNVIQPIVNFFMTYIFPIISKVVEIVAKIIEIVVVLIRVAIQQICTVIGNIVSWINTNVIQPVCNFFVWLWNTIVAGVQAFVTSVCNFFSMIGNWIYNNVIMPVCNFFVWLWGQIVAGVTAFVTAVTTIINTIVSWIQTNIIQPIANFFVQLWGNVVSGVTAFIEAVKVVFSTIVEWINTNIITPIANFFQSLWEKIQFAFQTVADTVSSVFKAVVNTVFNFIGGIINGIINGINKAISVINAIPGVSISPITPLEIPQLAQGGVVESPTTALIGEAGTEAVMPLENNTEWIGVLARMISTEMNSIRPTSSGAINTTNNNQSTNQDYLTNNNNTTQTIQGDTDNSVTFGAGSIQITAQNSSDEEAMRLAKKVMEYIKRQTEIDRMTQYA